MKENKWGFVLIFILLLAACQVIPVPATILVDDTVVRIKTSQRVPTEILAEAGILLGPDDAILYLGNAISPETELPGNLPITLSIRRASVLIINRSDGETWTLTSSAETIGEAFDEAGLVLSTSDLLEPSAETPLTGSMTVSWQPAVDIIISIGKERFQARSSAETVGNALADSGFPLMGLDYSIPPENEPIPADGQVRIIRVVENISLTTKSLPFGTRTELSAELEIDNKALLQGGEPGLAIARIRTRSEDGEEVSRLVESESLVRPPQDQVLGVRGAGGGRGLVANLAARQVRRQRLALGGLPVLGCRLLRLLGLDLQGQRRQVGVDGLVQQALLLGVVGLGLGRELQPLEHRHLVRELLDGGLLVPHLGDQPCRQFTQLRLAQGIDGGDVDHGAASSLSSHDFATPITSSRLPIAQ